MGYEQEEAVAALRKVTKAYPGKLAARDVTIEFRAREIHALCGENGAGKTTLVKILGGLIQPDFGTVEMYGKPVTLSNVRRSLAEGIGVVHQTGSLIETLTVGENLNLARILTPKPRDFWKLRGFWKRSPPNWSLPPEISEHDLVSRLSPRQRQLVEIHRLLTQEANLMVLDEPTAALSPREPKLLFRELRAIAESGSAIVVVSHKVHEIANYCHHFTVLREGRVIDEMDGTVFSTGRLIKHFGDGGQRKPRLKGAASSKNPKQDRARKALVRLKNLRDTDPNACEPLRGVKLTLRRGEILGLAGHSGSGVAGVFRALLGERAGLSGTVEWAEGLTEEDADVGFVPDRASSGLVASLTLAENLILRRRYLLGFALSRERRKERRNLVEGLIRDFNIKPAKGDALLRTLSGGNARKVLLAREVRHAKTLLLVVNPTAGLDHAAASFVRGVLRRKSQSGACVVVHSDDLDELARLCDRVAVFSAGRCVAKLGGANLTSAAIGDALEHGISAAVTAAAAERVEGDAA